MTPDRFLNMGNEDCLLIKFSGKQYGGSLHNSTILTASFTLQADGACTQAALGAVALKTALGLMTKVTQTGPIQHTVAALPLMRAGGLLKRVSTVFYFNTGWWCKREVRSSL